VAARSVTSSYGDPNSIEQLAKSNGSTAGKENSRRPIQTELRIRIGGELMVNLIEIAKPLTRRKALWHPSTLAGLTEVSVEVH
jgi:hypothetical protein